MKALLLGDFSPVPQNHFLFESGDIRTLFTDTLSLFENKDFSIVNLECALTEKDGPIKKFGPNLYAPRACARVLKEIGVEYAGLSNNHIFDFGIKGVRDTMKALDEEGIAYTGFGKDYEDARRNLTIEKNGERICVITVCEHEYSYALPDRMGSRPFDEYDTIEDIRAAKAECDRVIVMYHGGKEQCKYPSPRLVRVGRAMARSGADVVHFQHSHCIGCYEEYQGCHILYGQGNYHFICDEAVPPDGWNSLLAVTYDTVTDEITFTPIVNTELGITLAKGEEKAEIMRAFDERNRTMVSGEWRNHWHEFCDSVRELYRGVVKNAFVEGASQTRNDLFGHFLDCEAHTDVWRELFPTYNLTNEK